MKGKQKKRSSYKQYCKMLRHGAREERNAGFVVNPYKKRLQQLRRARKCYNRPTAL